MIYGEIKNVVHISLVSRRQLYAIIAYLTSARQDSSRVTGRGPYVGAGRWRKLAYALVHEKSVHGLVARLMRATVGGG